MSNGPVPSSRCLLSRLPKCEVGDKVRFLGCVKSYDLKSGTLTLEHETPRTNRVQAAVDVNLPLQNLKSGETDVGQWVHVIGYVTSIDKVDAQSGSSLPRTKVSVQAIVLWMAEDLDVAAYERTLQDALG